MNFRTFHNRGNPVFFILGAPTLALCQFFQRSLLDILSSQE